ncbi:MAG: beta-hydroxyacyl-ACP dehydratase [Clostridia bacterium]|nr:beta-hydroxyacyl-ACP dehydratase [Clostridia bacterium]NLF19935.1 3-hydroxyacyl-ACP dehydratase FabZ [Clostridiaceae bacterium]
MLYDREAIKQVLPHREPFLLIDTIEAIQDKTIIGTKQVTGDEFWVPGHFPQEPVMPGVLICETIAQIGAFYVLSRPEYKGKIAYFGRMDKVRFKNKVVPGDLLRLEVTIGKMRGPVGFGEGKAYVGDKLCCSLEMTFAIGDADAGAKE